MYGFGNIQFKMDDLWLPPFMEPHGNLQTNPHGNLEIHWFLWAGHHCQATLVVIRRDGIENQVKASVMLIHPWAMFLGAETADIFLNAKMKNKKHSRKSKEYYFQMVMFPISILNCAGFCLTSLVIATHSTKKNRCSSPCDCTPLDRTQCPNCGARISWKFYRHQLSLDIWKQSNRTIEQKRLVCVEATRRKIYENPFNPPSFPV